MRVAIAGAGYVGLVTGVCLADFGHDVVCIDNDPRKIEALQRGEIPIYEPGLAELVKTNVSAGRLSFAEDLRGAVAAAEVVFVAVGTPSRRGDGHADLSYVHADLSYVHAVAREVADAGPVCRVVQGLLSREQ